MRFFILVLVIICFGFFFNSCDNNLLLKDRAGWCNQFEDLIVEPNNDLDPTDEIVLDDDDDYNDDFTQDDDYWQDKREKEEKGPQTKVFICHLPPGNPLNAKTLRLPEAALKAHLAHGDYLGECEPEDDINDDVL
jgi:hypothetical protein